MGQCALRRMMSNPPGIMRVERHVEYPSVIKITSWDGADYYYHQNSNGILVLGYPYIAYSPDKRFVIHLFNPAGPGGLPYILSVEESGLTPELADEMVRERVRDDPSVSRKPDE